MIARWFTFMLGMLIGGSFAQGENPIVHMILAAIGYLVAGAFVGLLHDRLRECLHEIWPKIGVALLLALGATSADACDRCGFRSSHCVYKRAQLVVHPDVKINYFVGAPIRIEALIAEALRNDPDYQALQQFKALKRAESLEHRSVEPEHGGSGAGLAAKCASCHSGAKPKGGLFLDGSAPIPAAKLWEIEERMASDDPTYRMPPRGSLTETKRCQILIESTRLSRPE